MDLSKDHLSIDRIPEEVTIALYIQPKASRDKWVGWHGEEYKLAITAPPIDCKANAHVLKIVAKAFSVAKSQVMIERGELGRHKVVKIISPKLIPDDFKVLLEKH